PLRYLEELGTSRLLATLTEDVQAISNAVAYIPSLCIAIAVVLGCLVYLAWLSWIVFLGFVGFLVLAILSYQLVTGHAKQSLELAREEQDKLFTHFRAITEGTKELKLNKTRREAFFSEELEPTIAQSRQYNIIGMSAFTLGLSWIQFLLFAIIGLVDFGLPRLITVNQAVLSGYALTIIFLVVPLDAITTILPLLSKASIALKKIESLNLALASRSESVVGKSPHIPSQSPLLPLKRGVKNWKTKLPFSIKRGVGGDVHPRGSMGRSTLFKIPSEPTEFSGEWKQLELKNVTHAYQGKREESRFTLGPIDLTFHPQELIFIIGGNGSGKSTLAKLITGLYFPESGELIADGELITDQNREWYRQHFCAVFSDFYLFDTLLGFGKFDLDAQTQNYLIKLQLDHKVTVKNGRLSTTALSQGQRKRLALLSAYLENRPFYVFDEWASDQDPVFKDIFYTQLLPELKSRGKTVLVISHDDRYFHRADRIVKLDYGKLA
ncbi:MAG TPA: cyclic peptide export ABC transporter, partial [Coleofasciculaceae cyanobacterium]